MKNLLLILFVFFLGNFADAQTIGRLPYMTINQVYRGDTVQTKMQGDTAYLSTTKDYFNFDKPILINGVAVGGALPDTIPADKIQLNTSATISDALTEGEIGWDNTYKTMTISPGIDAVVFQVGQEIVAYVRNNSGATIADGRIVNITGAIGDKPTIGLASYTSEEYHNSIAGMTTMEIPNNSNGFICVMGVVNNINTSAFSEGDELYLSTSGLYTNTPPPANYHTVKVGVVTRSNVSVGSIGVRIEDIPKLCELSGVNFCEDDLNDGDIMVWDDANGYWNNEPVPSAGGIIDKTYSEAVALMSSGGLAPGSTYKITDKGDLGLFFTAVTTSQFSATGTRVMLCPSTYEVTTDASGNVWEGIWYSSGSYSSGDLVIWGAQVWENQTGAVGTATNDTILDATNWSKRTKFGGYSNNEYIEKTFNIAFDWDNGIITKQSDDKGNVVYYDDLLGLNGCDISDWNNDNIIKNSSFGIFNNKSTCNIENNNIVGFIYRNTGSYVSSNTITVLAVLSHNSSNIDNNVCAGNINLNTTPLIKNNNCVTIYSNSNTTGVVDNIIVGDIYNNTCGVIEGNRINGDISGNSHSGSIRDNANNGYIKTNSGTGNISNNTNNGYIFGNTLTSDITDPTVNK